MSGDRKIAAYLEARREYDALSKQRKSLDGSALAAWLARWGADLAQSKVKMQLAYGSLTGGELARAQRMLREGV